MALCSTKAGSRNEGAVYGNDRKNPDARIPPMQKQGPLRLADNRNHNLQHTGAAGVPTARLSTQVDAKPRAHPILAKLCPQIATATLILLHIYSGVDRPGTLRDLAAYAGVIAGVCICVIPMDIVSGNPAHHLLQPRMLLFLVDMILQGRVHFLQAGPPCETWSIARERLLNGIQTIIRTAAQPWGKDGLRPRALDQIFVANELLMTSLVLFVALLTSGGGAILEHPARPDSDKSCSIWKLDIIKRVLLAPAVELEHIFQGPLGQKTPKPTHLLCLRQPHRQLCIRKMVKRGHSTVACPQLLPDGSFGTSPLKAYPARMSAAMLASMWSSVVDPVENSSDFDLLISRLQERCRDIDDGTSNITPRSLPPPPQELEFSRAWPSENPQYGPDFNRSALDTIRQATKTITTWRDFPFLVHAFVQRQGNVVES